VNCVRARWPHACRSERYRDGRPRLSAATLVAAITRTWACQAPAIPSHRRRAQNSRDSPVPRMRTPLLAVRARRVLRSRAAVRRWADVSHSSLGWESRRVARCRGPFGEARWSRGESASPSASSIPRRSRTNSPDQSYLQVWERFSSGALSSCFAGRWRYWRWSCTRSCGSF
jgi:hypothetical protein